jgi:hypothetical protein
MTNITTFAASLCAAGKAVGSSKLANEADKMRNQAMLLAQFESAAAAENVAEDELAVDPTSAALMVAYDLAAASFNVAWMALQRARGVA